MGTMPSYPRNFRRQQVPEPGATIRRWFLEVRVRSCCELARQARDKVWKQHRSPRLLAFLKLNVKFGLVRRIKRLRHSAPAGSTLCTASDGILLIGRSLAMWL
jgi:hypothetical protein